MFQEGGVKEPRTCTLDNATSFHIPFIHGSIATVCHYGRGHVYFSPSEIAGVSAEGTETGSWEGLRFGMGVASRLPSGIAVLSTLSS